MTGKQFKNVEEELDWGIVHYFTYNGKKITDNGIEKLVNQLLNENEQLKQTIKKLEAQLYCPYDSVCINCVNEYLVKKGKYYVSKCKKGYEQCSKTDVKYCSDYER